jgi:hypothetical protein
MRKIPEDVITDCVFGALRYLPPRDAGTYLSWLVPHASLADGIAVEDVQLWPPHQNGREPDALVRCRCLTGEVILVVVEVKWENYTLDRRQALDQWRGFVLAEPANVQGVHAIFADRTDKALTRLEEDDEELGDFRELHRWRASRIVISWHDVARRILQCRRPGGSELLWRLADDVLKALRVLGRRPFDGFAQTLTMPEVSPAPELLFFHRGRFNWPATPRVGASERPAFWTGTSQGDSTDG